MVVAPCLIAKPHPDWSLVTEPSVYTMRSCGLLFSWTRSLISDSVLSAGHSRQCFHKFSGRSVWKRRRNRLGLYHSLVCLNSVSWHTCSIESSAWPIQDLPGPSLHPFVSFTASWSGLWGSSHPRCISSVRVRVCVCVCLTNTKLCLYIIFEVLCIHFCWSWKERCAHPCQWDIAVQKWPLLLVSSASRRGQCWVQCFSFSMLHQYLTSKTFNATCKLCRRDDTHLQL